MLKQTNVDGRQLRIEVIGNVDSEEDHVLEDILCLIGMMMDYRDRSVTKIIHAGVVAIGIGVTAWEDMRSKGLGKAQPYNLKTDGGKNIEIITGKIETFWVVLRPRFKGDRDICIETNWDGLHKKYEGGLNNEQVYGFYGKKLAATHVAENLLKGMEL